MSIAEQMQYSTQEPACGHMQTKTQHLVWKQQQKYE